jgi:Tol biopolymer transport system component
MEASVRLATTLAAMSLCVLAAHSQDLIAYTAAPQGAAPWPTLDVWIVRGDGTARRNLTNDGHSHNPSWSPDGKQILFIHDSTLSYKPPYVESDELRTHHPVELSVVDVDGRNRRILRVIEPAIYSAAWSPDGNWIAVSAAATNLPSGARGGLFLMDASGRGDLRLVVPNGWTPSWSPDGKRLAFAVEQPRGRWAIFTANVDGSDMVRLTEPSRMSGSPAWSPDGKKIAFDSVLEWPTSSGQVFVMNADGSDVRQVTTDSAWSCHHPSWSPSGDRLAVGCRSADSPCGIVSSTGHRLSDCIRRIFQVSALGGALTRLTDHDGIGPAFAQILTSNRAPKPF